MDPLRLPCGQGYGTVEGVDQPTKNIILYGPHGVASKKLLNDVGILPDSVSIIIG